MSKLFSYCYLFFCLSFVLLFCLLSTVFGLAIAQYEERIYVELAKIFEAFVRGQSKVFFEQQRNKTTEWITGMINDNIHIFKPNK
jgi:hypothetical protein